MKQHAFHRSDLSPFRGRGFYSLFCRVGMVAMIGIVAMVGIVGMVGTSGVASAQRIKDIQVVENTKSTDDTVILIADIEKGDKWRPEMAQEIEGYLVNSGLFKKVDVFTQPMAGGVRVTIVAKDKHSWVIAPTFYNQPTNKGGGVGFGENNLFGENKKLLLYGQIATGDTFFIGAYVDPSIAGSRFHWQYDLFLKRERVFEYAQASKLVTDTAQVRRSKLQYLNTGATVGFELFRRLKVDVRGRAAHVSYNNPSLVEGACLEDILGDPGNTGLCSQPDASNPVPAPGAEGWDLSTIGSLTYDTTANWYGIFSGDRYKASFERSLPGAGSDFDYWIASAQWVRARKYFARHNFIIKSSAAYGKDLPFQQELTAGGPDQRGLKNRQMRGNLKLAATFEYSVPVFTLKGFAVRAMTFADSTYTGFVNTDPVASQRDYLPRHGRLGLAPWKNTVGVGTRFYIRQIVLPLLGLDIGYGLERRALEVYFAIGLTAF